MEHTLEYKSPPKYRTYKKSHDAKGFQSKCITSKEFQTIVSKPCAYCGVKGPNGIDRVDPSKGYEKSNCEPCCKHCNYVKGNLSIEDFERWTQRFVLFQYALVEEAREA